MVQANDCLRMIRIETETQYNETMVQIDDLLQIVTDETPLEEPNMVEFIRLSDLVEEDEKIHSNIMNLK